MAKGDFGGMTGASSQGSPLDLASLIARARATQGGGQMGMGGMMPSGLNSPNQQNNQPPPKNGAQMGSPSMPPAVSGMDGMNQQGGMQQQRPMFGGFQPNQPLQPRPGIMANPFSMPAQGNTGVAGGVTRRLDNSGY